MKKNYNQNSLVNFSNSFLKHFNALTYHESIPVVDQALKNHKKVAVILFDGMGRNITRKHLSSKSFIRSHYLTTINSTFPPTTTAATTAFLTGKYPIETGWMSWAQYFEKYQRNIILFKNVDYNTLEKCEEDNIANKELPITTLFELIKTANQNVDTFDIKRKPINPDGPKTLKGLKSRINKTLKSTKECFCYFYFDSPDYEMHALGIDHKKVHAYVEKINDMVKRVTENNKDTIFFVFADHGHINTKRLDMSEHQDLCSLLSRPISFEKRTADFFVKEGKKEEFKALFNKYYGKYFKLFTKQEILDNELFGEGDINPKAIEFIGDYLAAATSNYILYASHEMKEVEPFKGHHAGMTQDEMLIDVSVYNE